MSELWGTGSWPECLSWARQTDSESLSFRVFTHDEVHDPHTRGICRNGGCPYCAAVQVLAERARHEPTCSKLECCEAGYCRCDPCANN